MSVSNELLLKAAKVYDCSEPVEGMKPKTQYEEHKKMTPDEFSREGSKLDDSDKEKAAAKAQPQKQRQLEQLLEAEEELRDTFRRDPTEDELHDATGTPYKRIRKMMPRYQPAVKAQQQASKTAAAAVAAAPLLLDKNFLNSISRKMLPHAAADLGGLAGGLAGVIGGGIHGAYDPGAAGEIDDEGNVRLKRRSRLMGALRGAAGYGLGGLIGGRVLGAAGGVAAAPYMYPVGQQRVPANVVPLNKSAAALSFGEKVARVVFKK